MGPHVKSQNEDTSNSRLVPIVILKHPGLHQALQNQQPLLRQKQPEATSDEGT